MQFCKILHLSLLFTQISPVLHADTDSYLGKLELWWTCSYEILRQTGTCDPSCRVCTWTNVSMSNRSKETKGWEMLAGMRSWGKLGTRCRKAKNQPLLLGLQQQKQVPMHDPCTQHQQGGGQATKPCSSPTHQSTPSSPHLRNRPTCSGSSKDTCYWFSPLMPQLSPSNASPEFLLCPLTNSVD